MLFGSGNFDEDVASDQNGSAPAANIPAITSSLHLIRQAEYSYEVQHHSVEAYRLSRAAYTIDPFNAHGLVLYVSSMVDLGMKTELFYLGTLHCT